MVEIGLLIDDNQSKYEEDGLDCELCFNVTTE